ncbi:MAG: hypothetical protein JNL01_04085 [Bdellovibrionales bacterium]|nr:hypothetical protein [Bdellovibrionales bacterium]
MNSACESCRSPEVTENCEACQKALCSDCVLNPEPGAFQLMPKIPSKLSHQKYCRFCFDETVQPAYEKYLENLEKAKNVNVFYKTQRKGIPLAKGTGRSKLKFTVEACPDRDETILRLAYQAAEMDYNGILDTEVSSEKVRHFGYQTSVWKGSASPAHINDYLLRLQDQQEQEFR